jgi:hypothetical protein
MAALLPDSVKVDEQDLADFLVFAYRLGQQIIYYKASGQADDNQPDGNWQNFFTTSVPVQLALISKTRPQLIRETYYRQLDKFLGDRTSANLAPILLTWSRIFDQIRQWYISLESYSPFLSIIRGLVKSNLRDALLRMWAFERSYAAETPLREMFYQQFKDTFHLDIDIRNPPPADQTPLKDSLFEARTELEQVFHILFQNYRQIIQQAPTYLTYSLESRHDHPPHLALYLAFWEVLKPARDDLNRMTQRHLDFFYREILRFPEKAVQPDRAHLLFELAKFQSEYKLSSGTVFNAGKDASGVELIYKLNEDIVVHTAQIASLKGLFLAAQTTKQGKQLTGLYASPIANSKDGKGGEFPKDQVVKAWKPFGDETRSPATVGLAIASNVLLLQEGNRTITIQLDLKENPSEQVKSVSPKLFDLPEAILQKLFQVKLSGVKDWIQATIQSVTRELLTNEGSATHRLTIQVEVPLEQPAIVPCHNALQQPSFPTIQQPVLLLQLNTDFITGINLENNSSNNKFSPYHFLRSFDLIRLTLTVAVDAAHNLIVQNDLSVLDATKPFQPFGAQPKVGSNFYIGSQEVFQKPLTELKINFTLERNKPTSGWSEIYAAYGVNASDQLDGKSFDPGLLKVNALRQKTWNPTSPEITVNLFDSKPISLSSSLDELKLQSAINIESIEGWTPQTQNGFLRLQLTGDSFLHDRYTTTLARQVLATATSEILTNGLPSGVTPPQRKAVIGAYYRIGKGTPFSATDYYVATNAEPLIPQEPYTPVITSISLSYTAKANYIPPSTTGQTQQQDIQLVHLYPFDGFREITSLPSKSLLPTFVDEGTLYIGIQDLNPPTALPLLIQVAEETANTDLPKASVQWSYLASNTWQPFEEHQVVSDRTNGLITSGIVQLAIPAGITKGNTVLDSNLYWIKVAVAERSGAICDIVGIHTQAAQVTFSDQGNDPAHLVEPLPGGAIAKLADPQPEVKKIEQPYPSFGGQGKEAPANYYVRVSEHLRHKGRAVTIFDYERLVLERFPEIYKVRCINHGRINDTISDPTRDNLQELVPGSVTLAVIPDLSHRATTNDLQPKVNVNLLDDIRNYLMELSSSWVDIRVVNPRYEAIQAEFQVQFKSPYQSNFGYYQRELQRGIIGFLSPWTVNSGAEIHFGGKVYRSSILNFVEEQPYVDYVLNFQMHQGNQRNLREVVASSARSILVSVAFADNPNETTGHLIHPVDVCPANRPIDSGVLGYDPLDQLTLE